jgi:hypothetical protein
MDEMVLACSNGSRDESRRVKVFIHLKRWRCRTLCFCLHEAALLVSLDNVNVSQAIRDAHIKVSSSLARCTAFCLVNCTTRISA